MMARINHLGSSLLRQSLWGYARHGVLLATTVVLTPRMLHALGREGFGYWSSCFALVGLLGLMDVGLGTSLVRFCARAVGAGDHGVRNRTASSLMACAIASSVVAALVCALAALAFPAAVGGHARLPGAQICLAVLLLRGVVLQIPAGMFRGLLFAEHQLVVADQIQIAATLAYGIGMYACLAAGGGLAAAAWVNLAAMLAEHAAYALACALLLPSLRLSPHHVRWQIVTEVAPFAARQTLINVATFIQNRMDLLIVGLMFGLEPVATYGIALKIVESLQLLLKQGVNILAPRFARLAPEAWHTTGAKQVLDSARTVIGLTALVCAALAAVSTDLLRAWVGTGFAGATPVLLILLAAALVNMVIAVPSVALAMCNRDELVSRAATWSTASNLVLSVVLAKLIGPTGVAVATAVSQLCVALPLIVAGLRERFAIAPSRFLAQAVAPSFPLLIAFAAAALWRLGAGTVAP